MPFMDLVDKGVAWATKICQMFEAMCLELDEFMHKHAEQAKANQGDMPPPTSDEFGGCKSFRKARENGDIINATVHPSSAPPPLRSVTGKDSSEHEAGTEDNPAAACRTVPAIELSEDGLEANKFAKPELSVSLPENGKSDHKPWIATVQASERAKLKKTYIAVNSNKVCPYCNGANHCYCKESEVPKTRLVRGKDRELQAGDVEAGSNQQKGCDSWAPEWVIV